MPTLIPAIRKATKQLMLVRDWLRQWCRKAIVRWAWFLRINIFFVFVLAVLLIGVSQWERIQYLALNGFPSKPETVQLAEEEVGHLYQQWKYSRHKDYLNLLLFRVEKLRQFYPQSSVIEQTLDKMLDQKTFFLKRSKNNLFYIFE